MSSYTKMPREKLTDEEKAIRKTERQAKKAIAKESPEEIEEKKKRLLEKAKEIEGKVKVEKKAYPEKEIKGKEEKSEEKKSGKKEVLSKESKLDSAETLIPLETYLKAGSYIGTKVIYITCAMLE